MLKTVQKILGNTEAQQPVSQDFWVSWDGTHDKKPVCKRGMMGRKKGKREWGNGRMESKIENLSGDAHLGRIDIELFCYKESEVGRRKTDANLLEEN